MHKETHDSALQDVQLNLHFPSPGLPIDEVRKIREGQVQLELCIQPQASL